MAAYYVCKNIFKYSSEIEYLLRQARAILELPELDMLSIGCGPCSDLFGALSFLDHNEQSDKEMRYLGVDLNPIWLPIQDYIGRDIGDGKEGIITAFKQEEFSTLVENLRFLGKPWTPNIVVLEYVFSDMFTFHYDIKGFVDRFAEFLFPLMPPKSFIMINDINHRDVRPYFSSLHSSLFKRSKQIHVSTWHFVNDFRWFYSYGTQHSQNYLTVTIPSDIRKRYNPWRSCSSAQMLIYKSDQ
jgi:hypothetical protein